MTARNSDAKKEVDTARRRAYLFFLPFFRGAFSVGGFSVDAHRPRRPGGKIAPRRRCCLDTMPAAPMMPPPISTPRPPDERDSGAPAPPYIAI